MLAGGDTQTAFVGDFVGGVEVGTWWEMRVASTELGVGYVFLKGRKGGTYWAVRGYT